MKPLVALLLLPALAIADPSSVTRYLMNEPASLMDIGMLHMVMRVKENLLVNRKDYVTATGNEDITVSARIRYRFDDDLMDLSYTVVTSDVTKAELGCSDVVIYGAIWFRHTAPWVFLHREYESEDERAELIDGLLRRTEVNCRVFTGDQDLFVTTTIRLPKLDVSVTRHWEEPE